MKTLEQITTDAKALCQSIKTDYRQFGLLMIEAKALVPHGQWIAYLESNFPEIGKRQAQKYMKLAKSETATLQEINHEPKTTARSFFQGPTKTTEAKRPPEPAIDPATLSLTAQQKLDAAIRQHQRRLDATFKDRVESELKRLVEAMVLPSFYEAEADAQAIINSRRYGIFTRDEYNAILFVVHPDRNPTDAEKNEALRLFREKRIVLLSNKDDPRKYPKLPTAAEFMNGRGR